jgi:hypothetical protein
MRGCPIWKACLTKWYCAEVTPANAWWPRNNHALADAARNWKEAQIIDAHCPGRASLTQGHDWRTFTVESAAPQSTDTASCCLVGELRIVCVVAVCVKAEKYATMPCHGVHRMPRKDPSGSSTRGAPANKAAQSPRCRWSAASCDAAASAGCPVPISQGPVRCRNPSSFVRIDTRFIIRFSPLART